MLPVIHSHDSWTQLEEVWLGDVYPAGFYDHLAPEVRDVFYHITEITQQDLAAIQRTLEGLGVQVRRPQYRYIDQFIDPRTDQLVKPQICPRDIYVTLGTTLYVSGSKFAAKPWEHVVNEYRQHGNCAVKINANAWFNGANTVRMGQNLIVDFGCWDGITESTPLARDEFSDYQVKFIYNGGHVDGCFAVLRPGLLLASSYYDRYDETFPGWDIIRIAHPSYHDHPRPPSDPAFNGKFWDTGAFGNKAFGQHIIEHALDWVGTYTETYFELNCLVVNEKNVVMLGGSERLADELESRGITVHWVPFRTRTFWDGGVHCLTVDIRRQGGFVNYFL